MRFIEADDNSVTSSMNATQKAESEHAQYWAYMEEMETMPIDVIKAIMVSLYSTGIVANLLLLIYIIRFRRYTSPTFMLIFSLGCCDFFTCGTSLMQPLLMYPTLPGQPWLCSLCIYFTSAFYNTSVAHMMFFSVLRFYQLVFPLQALSKVTSSLVAKCCVWIWICVCIFTGCIPLYFNAHVFPYKGKNVVICEYDPNAKAMHLFAETVILLLPNVVIGAFHLAKHCIVKQRVKKGLSEHEQKQGQTTDARAVTVVIVVFLMTSQPNLVHTFIHHVFGVAIQTFHQIVYIVSLNLLYGNSAFNPFIYVFCASSIRRDVLNMIRCKDVSV